MSALPPFRQIDFSTIPGAPQWFSGFLTTLNLWLSAVYDTVNKGTTLGTNIPAQLTTLAVPVNADGTFAAPSVASTLPGGTPQACLLARVRRIRGTPAQVAAISLNQWDYVAGSVQMTVVGMQPACTYQLTFLLL